MIKLKKKQPTKPEQPAAFAFKKPRDVIKAPKTPKACPFESEEDYKGFAAQYPNEAAFFGKIVVRWRGSKAKLKSTPGYWAAYPYADWAERMKCSVPTIKRWLNRLEDHGLIERYRSKWGGKAVYTYIRPTPAGLAFAKARPTDIQHLGFEAVEQMLPEPKAAPNSVQTTSLASTLTPSIHDEKPLTLAELQALENNP